jgi:hypothetical protein
MRMSRSIRTEPPVFTVRIMAVVCVALAIMCASLALAWKSERDEAACWRAAAEFQLQPQGDCRG